MKWIPSVNENDFGIFCIIITNTIINTIIICTIFFFFLVGTYFWEKPI